MTWDLKWTPEGVRQEGAFTGKTSDLYNLLLMGYSRKNPHRGSWGHGIPGILKKEHVEIPGVS